MRPLNMESELLKHILRRPVTEPYPYKSSPPAEGLRGRPHIAMEECIGCGLCVRRCPSHALEMEGKKEEASLRIHLDRCLFCGQCARSCPRQAIQLTPDFELASSDRERLVLHFDRACQEE